MNTLLRDKAKSDWKLHTKFYNQDKINCLAVHRKRKNKIKKGFRRKTDNIK